MPKQTVEFTTDGRFVRRARELSIIEAMVRMYCRGHDHSRRDPLCADCAELFDYATRRLERCVFGDAKPTCTNCTVHCYSAQMREQVRVVMKWAGPRMPLRHPILSILHMIDGRRPAPLLPATPPKRIEKSGPTQHAAKE
ncbi:MAG: nitrous oxide-stimulated promoter family protein [Pseudomonadota bacterium]